MPSYVFLGNSTKPSKEEAQNREPIKLDNVSRPYLQAAINMGYEVYLGVNRDKPNELKCDELPIKLYDSHTYRSIIAFKDNWIAYHNLYNLVKEKNIEVIHCNSPVGGMIGRIVGRICHVKKVIYTAHGFHFYKGAPLFNRTVLKWAEQIMARWTDVIITINQEDFEAAKKFQMKKGGKVYYLPGIGIDTSLYKTDENVRLEKRTELGLSDDDVALISMGDLIKRKNYATAIRAIAEAKNLKLQYYICGNGIEKGSLTQLVQKLGVNSQIHFLGIRNDIKDLLLAADIFLFTTKQEGLPRSMMEAMASGLPCITSRIRGNTDLIENTEGGFLCETNDISDYAEKINLLADDKSLRKKMGEKNLINVMKFDIENVKQRIIGIYQETLE